MNLYIFYFFSLRLSSFILFICTDKPATPVITNLETSTCIVNLTWSANEDAACPLTEYTIYYRQTEIEESSWNKIDIKTVSKTNHEWSLRCYAQYEFAVSAWNDMGQSNLSATRQIKTSVKQGNNLCRLIEITFIFTTVQGERRMENGKQGMENGDNKNNNNKFYFLNYAKNAAQFLIP